MGDETHSTNFSTTIARLSKLTVDVELFKALVQDNGGDLEVELDWFRKEFSASHVAVLSCIFYKDLADAFYVSQDYMEAIKEYTRVAFSILGSNRQCASGREDDLFNLCDEHKAMYNDICEKEDTITVQLFLHLISCLKNIALCWSKTNDHVRTIDFLLEAQKMYTLRDYFTASDGYPWRPSWLHVLEFAIYFLESRVRIADILFEVGNTAAAGFFYMSCSCYGDEEIRGFEEVKALTNILKLETLMRLRHPDFKSTSSVDVVYPEMQLRGDWRRLHTHRGLRPRKRAGFSSWIWRNCLYVYGGIDYCKKRKNLQDIWCLDLRTMNSWRRLPDYPSKVMKDHFCSQHTKMCVWNDEAWLFFGDKVLFKFDLLQEKWYAVPTIWGSKDPWPYEENVLVDYCAEVFEGKLHIFGGLEKFPSIGVPGINLHMVLDLCSLRWTKLGGTTKAEQLIRDMPSLRKGAGSWVVPHERRMYILYGCASMPQSESPDSQQDHQHEDAWSYSFDENKWTLECFRGNFPAPRAKMACVYNPMFNHVIVFGGTCSRLFSVDDKLSKVNVPFAHLADTFILDMETRIWKMVLTHNFPEHRMYCTAIVDDATGKTYLYGGCRSSYLMPSKNADELSKTASLGDMWELDLHLLTGDIEEKKCKTRGPLIKFGPWKLCFGCGEYKVDMFACGGSCGGRIFLCSADCQKKCWREHERLHNCRRI